jgi:hypothetical protein
MPVDLPERPEQPESGRPARRWAAWRGRLLGVRSALAPAADAARDVAGAAWRRFQAGPRGTLGMARWLAAWAAYALAALAAGTAWRLAGPPGPAVLLALTAVAVLLPSLNEHSAHAPHWAMYVFVALLAAIWVSTQQPPWAQVVVWVALCGVAAREPLARALGVVLRWASWLAAALGAVAAYALLADAGLAALRPAVAWVDPPQQPLWDVAVAGVARVVAASLALVALAAVVRHYRRRRA